MPRKSSPLQRAQLRWIQRRKYIESCRTHLVKIADEVDMNWSGINIDLNILQIYNDRLAELQGVAVEKKFSSVRR